MVHRIVGRYRVETIMKENRPIGEVFTKLGICSNEKAE